MVHDVIVVGGAFAGLSAALQLARARRSVLVIDAGQPRNRFAAHSHGFLGQDGRTPADILATAREQLRAYRTAMLTSGEATSARWSARGFEVATGDGQVIHGSRLILTTGVKDTLPPVAGLDEEWGKSVFVCPYCDGYEVGGGAIGVLATGPMSSHQAMLLTEWGDVTFFLNGAAELDDGQRAELAGRGVTIETTAVNRWTRERDGTVGFDMADGRRSKVKALFTGPRISMASPIAEQLGLDFEQGPLGPYVRVDDRQRSSVANVFAAGDAARPMHSVALAVAGGAMAGIAAHQSLVFEAAA
ncbi:MAG: NAD(P)/FAD-dependent oxidoreductase [Rhizobiaceae bacterium]